MPIVPIVDGPVRENWGYSQSLDDACTISLMIPGTYGYSDASSLCRKPKFFLIKPEVVGSDPTPLPNISAFQQLPRRRNLQIVVFMQQFESPSLLLPIRRSSKDPLQWTERYSTTISRQILSQHSTSARNAPLRKLLILVLSPARQPVPPLVYVLFRYSS
jgi:hypothetical protein